LDIDRPSLSHTRRQGFEVGIAGSKDWNLLNNWAIDANNMLGRLFVQGRPGQPFDLNPALGHNRIMVVLGNAESRLIPIPSEISGGGTLNKLCRIGQPGD
jgi:hypothetical protein